MAILACTIFLVVSFALSKVNSSVHSVYNSLWQKEHTSRSFIIVASGYALLLLVWELITHFYPLHIENRSLISFYEAAFEGVGNAVVYPVIYFYFLRGDNKSDKPKHVLSK